MIDIESYDTLREIAEFILNEAKKQGADQAQVMVSSNENIATRFGESHITQNTQSNSIDFNLETQIGQQVGGYNGTAANLEKLPKLIGQAIELVKFSPPDPEFPGFVEEKQEYQDIGRDIIEYTPSDLADAVKLGVDASLETNSKVASIAGSINYNATRMVLMNTFDLYGESDSSTISGIVNVAAREGDNESRSSDSIAGLTIDDLQMQRVGGKVAENAVRGLNQGELEVGGYETILGHSAIMELMFHFALASSSTMLINHQSPFKDKLGEQLFGENFTITDATADASHYSSQKFDTDGIPSETLTYIENGIVKDFAYNRRNAEKLGVETNGRAAGNFALFRTPVISSGSKSEEELIGTIDNGVFVSNLWYTNFVNMPDGSITGLTKDGVFKIENGEIVGTVKNMRFTDTLFSMFKELEPANNTMMKLHSTYGNLFGLAGKLPSVKIENFNFTSKGKH